MRHVWVLAAFLALAFVPQGSSAAAFPVLVWPTEGLQHHDEAANLTEWFAGRLGAQLDPSRAPSWTYDNWSLGPEFLTARDKYVLPVMGGTVEAAYSQTAFLMEVWLAANTTYRAASLKDADLHAVAAQVAADLGVDVSRAPPGIEVVFPVVDNKPQFDDAVWTVRFVESTILGYPFWVNALSVSFRASDLVVMAVVASPWYSVSGTPELSKAEAVAVGAQFAEEKLGARNVIGGSDSFAVRDGQAFVYIVYLHWPAEDDPYCHWLSQVWVEANFGAIAYWTPPGYACEGGGPPPGGGGGGGLPPGSWPWVILPLSALLVALSLWFRLEAKRALDQFTRGQIFGYVAANPGARYAQVRSALRLSNGTLAYHLWVLERTGFVRSQREGRARFVFPRGETTRQGQLILSSLQFAILDLVHAQGPLAPMDIARRLALSKQRVHYNLKTLGRLLLIGPSADGRWVLSMYGVQAVSSDRSNVTQANAANG